MLIEVLSTNKNQLPARDGNVHNTHMSRGWIGNMSFLFFLWEKGFIAIYLKFQHWFYNLPVLDLELDAF